MIRASGVTGIIARRPPRGVPVIRLRAGTCGGAAAPARAAASRGSRGPLDAAPAAPALAVALSRRT